MSEKSRRTAPLPPAVQAARELTAAVDALHGAVITTRELLDRRLPAPQPIDIRAPRKVTSPLVLRLFPQLAREFQKKVPAEYVRELDGEVVVECVCGVGALVPFGEIEPCRGDDCDRYFLRTEIDVRVARWEPVELEDRYAGPGWTPVAA